MRKTVGMLVLLVLIASCNHGEGNKPNNPVPPPTTPMSLKLITLLLMFLLVAE